MRLSRREALLIPAIGLADALLGPGPARAAEVPLIEVLPLGSAPGAADLEAVVGAIRAFFAVRLSVLPPMPLPRSAFYPSRGRYRAERLLEVLAVRKGKDARVALGLTAVDISTTKGAIEDWGVLGLATLDGSSAVLSSYRCHRAARQALQVSQRFAKTAVHELGHSFGLPHCPTRGCLMHDGEGSVLTTDTETDFCPETRERLARAGVLRDGGRTPFG